MRKSEFIQQLRTLAGTPVHDLDDPRKSEIMHSLAAELVSGKGELPEIEWVPFVTGRRPVDEAASPGLGSSDKVALILDSIPDGDNRAYLLYRLKSVPVEDAARYAVRLSLSLAGPWGDVSSEPLPEWNGRPIPPLRFGRTGDGQPILLPVDLTASREGCLAFALEPSRDLVFEGAFTFEHFFMQQVRAEVVLLRDGVPLSASQMLIDVCDARRIGSLYRRVIERVVTIDTQAQARAHGIDHLDAACHPWYPVLLIGSEKTHLYMRALVEDIVRKQRHLTDPGWLLKVGIYLELLTCLGIFDAVRADVGDALTPEERAAYESAADFAPIREAVNASAWKDVWALRKIAMPPRGSRPGPKVAAKNLLAKKAATLAFLEAHHHDLRHAIRLAGPNDHNAQETWHRVFRDAERAVLRKTPAAFAELAAFPAKAQEFILWHRKGVFSGLSLPTISSWFGDQDGLYANACNQYRASMNEVAEWARHEGLMDHTGSECIPEAVSLLKTMMEGREEALMQLQRRDGYAGAADLPTGPACLRAAAPGTIVALLRAIPIFRILTDEEIQQLAATVRPIELGPVERIIVQGRKGTSLFIVAEGNLEVMVRQKDGVDLPVAVLEQGSVFGEMSLLTGQRRSATVRSIETAVVYEVGQQQLAPILRSRPAAVNELAAIMAPRLHATAAATHGYESRKAVVSLSRRIRTFLLSPI
ncbi:MAG TPA: cyclic nucleotide-binding domain-containing protein [Thermoanaerobaculia bacterium]|nr:cyclic nucleotide-binding domain-containing protein [Thermoanaerobaculia bacterium]